MVCRRFGVCLAVLLLAVCCGRAHSQDCEATINITESVVTMNVFADALTRTCFMCFFGSPPTTNSMTTWTLNGDLIPSSEGMVDDGVLVIFDPAVTFDILVSRTLSCSSSAGTIAVFAQAVVLVPPGVEDMTVNERDTLTIRCESDTSTGITEYRWTGPDGADVSTLRTLEIANIQRSQSGVYTCFITNFQSSVISANATVTIQYAPDVNTPISSPHLSPLDQPLTLSCSYDAVPAPNVTWMRDAVALSEDNRTSVILNTSSSSSVLTIADLQRDEGGAYVCMFSNEVGSGVASIQVTVQVPPDPASDLQVTDRSTVTFDLSWGNPAFDGNSPLTGIRIEYQASGSSDVMSMNILSVVEVATLTDLRPLTNYTISVLVLNSVGPSDPVSITERTDSELPEAPSITSFTAVNSTALLVEWEAPRDPDSTAPFESFLVQYNQEGVASLQEETIEDPEATSFVLAGLAKGTSYTVRVAASNEAGLGPFSGEMTAETDIDPPSPPQNVTVVGLTSLVLRVTWTPPQDSGGRDIGNYQLEVREVGEADFGELQTLGAEVREAKITDREENTTYEVRLTAISTILGEPAVAMGTTQPIGEPQALLVAPVADMSTISSVRLSWEDPGGVVNFYVVEYKLRIDDWANLGDVEMMLVNGTIRMTTISGLDGDSTYEARIRTRNDNDDSEPSPPVTFETLPVIDISGPVGVVTAGQSVTLTCSIVGGGVTTNVEWFQGTNGPLPQGATVNRSQLTFADPQPDDSGVYTCSSRGGTSSFTLNIEPSEGISTTIIIVVAAVGGVALVLFLVVFTIACCYCCHHRRRNSNKGVYTVRTKNRGNWIETSGGASGAAAASANERPPERAPSFRIPADYTTHSSFNTLEKQNRIKRSQSPDPRPAQGGQGDVSYAQLDLSRPSADVHGSTGNVQYTQVSAKPASAVAKPAPAVSHEVGSPTFQYIAQESLGFPAPRYGSGTVSPPENFDMTWPDGSTPPHYSNTVV